MKLRITNAARIRNVLRSLQSSDRKGTLLLDGRKTGTARVICGVNEFRLDPDHPADTLRIPGWAGVYEFHIRRKGNVCLPPRNVLLSADRRDRRLDPGASFEATADGEPVELVDLSWRGARLRNAPLHIRSLDILVEGDPIPVQHQVMWREGDDIGLALEPNEELGEALSDELLHTRTTSTRPAARALWEALRDWYFQIRGPGETGFAAIHDAWAEVLQTQLRSSRSAHVVLHRQHWATLSFLRLYSRTWIGHQLGALRRMHAVDRGDSEQIKRDLYAHCFETAQMRMDDEPWWVMGSCRSASWLRRHWDFARSVESLGGVNLSILPVEIPTQTDLKVFDRRTDCELSRVDEDPDAMALLFEALARTRPEPWLQAFDLVPERYDLAETRARLAEDGLEIARRTWFASEDGDPKVAMVLEIATRGINAFRLFDSVRFFELVPDLSEAELDRCRHALTVEAYDFFRGERDVLDDGRRDYFVVNIEESGRMGIPKFFDHFENHEPLGHGFSWVIPSASVPAFLERIWESTPNAAERNPPRLEGLRDDNHRPHTTHPLAHPDAQRPPPEPGGGPGDADAPGHRGRSVTG